jgi:cellulose synthase/poly-beta-1,6-N-acetylglucosamine synthase-like glycosyltransferase
MAALEVAFWVAVGLLLYTHVGYPLLLLALTRGRQGPPPEPPSGEPPRVTLIVAAHDEEQVIGGWVACALALDYPRDRLEIVVACDGCSDETASTARKSGAHRVLELERGGKVAALNAAVAETTGDVLAFSDANAVWEPEALRMLVARLAEREVGYVCGQVRFEATQGTENEEGLYWRYEMTVRGMESELGGVTAGNGAINAVRREAYVALEPGRGQDISLPFELAKRGWRSAYEPEARATEPMAATIEGEFRRKRRMMAGAWNTILRTGLLSPRGYSPIYMVEIYSHRLLRYATPILHLVALGTNIALVGSGGIYVVTLACQVAFAVAALLGGILPWRPLRIARYYAAVTASSAVGLWDLLSRGVPHTWESVEGTR